MNCTLDLFDIEQDSEDSFFQALHNSSSRFSSWQSCPSRNYQQKQSSQSKYQHQSYQQHKRQDQLDSIQTRILLDGYLEQKEHNISSKTCSCDENIPILKEEYIPIKNNQVEQQNTMNYQTNFDSREQETINSNIHAANLHLTDCQFQPETSINLQVKDNQLSQIPLQEKQTILPNQSNLEKQHEENDSLDILVKPQNKQKVEATTIKWQEFKDILPTMEKYILQGGIVIDLSEFKDSDNLKIDSRSSILSQLFNFSQIHKYRKFIAGWVDFKQEALRQPSEIINIITSKLNNPKQTSNLVGKLTAYQNYLDARLEQIQAVNSSHDQRDRLKSQSVSTNEDTNSLIQPDESSSSIFSNEDNSLIMKQLDRVLKQFEKYHYSFRVIRKHFQGIDQPCIGMSNSYLEFMGFDAKDNILAALRNYPDQFFPYVDAGDLPSELAAEQMYAVTTPLRDQQRYYNSKQGEKYIQMTIPHTDKTVKAKIQTRIFSLNVQHAKIESQFEESLGYFVEIKLFIPETYETPQINRGKRKFSELKSASSVTTVEAPPLTKKACQYSQAADQFKKQFYSSQMILPPSEIFRKKWTVRSQYDL